MLLVLLLLYAGVSGFENDDCDFIIKLKNREVRQLLSPNHPHKQPPWSTCRWTVFSDTDRRIVFVCPFHHTLEKIYTPEDPLPCNGKFTVSFEGGEEMHHCQDRGFSEISSNGRMVITYENPLKTPLDNFTCYLYAELKSRLGPGENSVETAQFDYNITLRGKDVAALVSPSEDKKGWSNRRWTVFAPNSTRMTLVCPYTDKPPLPLTIQAVPCYGQFTVLTDDRNETYYCRQRSFSHSTNSSKMVVIYNPKRSTAENFDCFVYSEDNSVEEFRPDMVDMFLQGCNHYLNFAIGEVGVMVSPKYPNEVVTSSTCRWAIFSPKTSRTLISCSLPRLPGVNKCLGRLKISRDHRQIDIKSCLKEKFSYWSNQSLTDVMYDSNHGHPPFLCYAHVMKSTPLIGCTKCTVPGRFKNEACDHFISLHRNEMRQLKSPNHPNNEPGNTTCRWTVVAPADFRIILLCHSDAPGLNATGVLPCNGQITVFTDGESRTVHCSDRTFSRTSLNNRMVLMYENQLSDSIQPFRCTLYAEKISPFNLTIMPGIYTYGSCDMKIRLAVSGMTLLRSPKYPKDEPGRNACRWSVVAPSNNRVILSCPTPQKQPIKTKPCNPYISVSTVDRPKSYYCRDTPFLQVSANDRMVITYENVSPKTFESFECYLYSELQSPINDCENCTVAKTLPYAGCDENVHLSSIGMKELKTHPGSSCRWIVMTHPNSRIFLNCHFHDKLPSLGSSCTSSFKVVTPGNETRYCSGVDFSQFSLSNWMTITFDNPSPGNRFKCQVFREQKLPRNESGTSTGAAALDFRRCDNTITLNETGVPEPFTSLDYPLDMPPAIPCRWTVHSPINTFISISCPNLRAENADDICNGYFTLYPTGNYENPIVKCRHAPFTLNSTSTEMIVTYGNQLGSSRKHFNCFAVALDKTCRHSVQLPNLSYNEYYKLPVTAQNLPPWPPCFWSIKSPPNTQIYLVCNQDPPTDGKLLVSATGDDNLIDATVRSLDTDFTEVSVTNKMSIQFNITETAKNNQHIGCKVFVERSPPWGEECNCGNKFNKMKPLSPSSYSRVLGGKKTIRPNEYPMMAAIVDYTNRRRQLCAATIISDRYALTAAKCLFPVMLLGIGLLVGTTNLTQGNSGTLYRVDFFETHHHFNRKKTEEYDVGVVSVIGRIRFNDNVRPVCLPFYNRNQSFSNEYTINLGWGQSDAFKKQFERLLPSSASDTLLRSGGVVHPATDCKYDEPDHVAYGDMCVKLPKWTNCQAYTGGPVLWKDPFTGLLKLIGVISPTNKCDYRGFTKAMNVVDFLDWIEKILRMKF